MSVARDHRASPQASGVGSAPLGMQLAPFAPGVSMAGVVGRVTPSRDDPSPLQTGAVAVDAPPLSCTAVRRVGAVRVNRHRVVARSGVVLALRPPSHRTARRLRADQHAIAWWPNLRGS